MLSTLASPTTRQQQQKTNKTYFVFVVQQHDGTFVIGEATNPAKRIAAINSGYCPFIPQPMSIARIVDVRETGENRSLVSVVKYFCDKYSADKVRCV